MDAVGVIMIAALPFTGIITVEETLVGFSDPNIVLITVILGLFISNAATAVLMAQ